MGFSRRERDDAVQLYRSLGLQVFPYDTRSVPFIGWSNPALWTPAYESLVPKVHTIGVLLDEHTVVIDIDANRGGSLAELEDRFGPLPPTLTVVTPSSPRNVHLYFRSTVPLRTTKRIGLDGIDFLAKGSHVKGATSVRYVNTQEERMYVLQRPVLEPALLPGSLEAEWAATCPGTEQGVWSEEIAEAVDSTPRQRMNEKERRFVQRKIRAALDMIRSAGPGKRHDATFRGSREIYRAAVLLGQPMERYDGEIIDAYLQSGGTDVPWLETRLWSVKVWSAKHPMPRPGVSAYHARMTAEIAAWADNALASIRKQDKAMRALILALANEATTSFRVSTAATILAGRYKGVGSQQTVSENLHRLVRMRLLVQNGGQVSMSGHYVPHWKLERGLIRP